FRPCTHGSALIPRGHVALVDQCSNALAIESNSFPIGACKMLAYQFLRETSHLRKFGMFGEKLASERVIKHKMESGHNIARFKAFSFCKRGKFIETVFFAIGLDAEEVVPAGKFVPHR